MATIRLDETDIKLLELLQKNSKMTTQGALRGAPHIKDARLRAHTPPGEVGSNPLLHGAGRQPLVGLPLTVFLNVALAAHDNEHVMAFQSEIIKIDEVMECYSIGGNYDILLKVVVKDLDAYNKFVFEKLTKVPAS